MNISKLRQVIREEIEQLREDKITKYKKLVRQVMDMVGIKSPNELTDDQKAKFFSYLDMIWDKESGTPREQPSQAELDKIMK